MLSGVHVWQALEEDSLLTKAGLESKIEKLSKELRVAEEDKSLLRKQFADFSDTTALMDTTRELESTIVSLKRELADSKLPYESTTAVLCVSEEALCKKGHSGTRGQA